MGAVLPFASVEPRLNGINHHGGERDFLIERVLADALVKLDREVNRGLAEALPSLARTRGSSFVPRPRERPVGSVGTGGGAISGVLGTASSADSASRETE